MTVSNDTIALWILGGAVVRVLTFIVFVPVIDWLMDMNGHTMMQESRDRYKQRMYIMRIHEPVRYWSTRVFFTAVDFVVWPVTLLLYTSALITVAIPHRRDFH